MTKNNHDIIVTLKSLLCWMQSIKCNEAIFDNVSDYGDVKMSIDEALFQAIILLSDKNIKEKKNV